MGTLHRTGVSLLVVSVEEVAGNPVNALLETFWVMSGCPISTSADCPFCVGMEFQMSTRFCPTSLTKRRVPSLVTETGLSMLDAEGFGGFVVTSNGGAVVKSLTPSTRSACWSLLEGIWL